MTGMTVDRSTLRALAGLLEAAARGAHDDAARDRLAELVELEVGYQDPDRLAGMLAGASAVAGVALTLIAASMRKPTDEVVALILAEVGGDDADAP